MNVRALPVNVAQLHGMKKHHVHPRSNKGDETYLRSVTDTCTLPLRRCKSGSLNLEDPFIKHLSKVDIWPEAGERPLTSEG